MPSNARYRLAGPDTRRRARVDDGTLTERPPVLCLECRQPIKPADLASGAASIWHCRACRQAKYGKEEERDG